MSLCHGRRWVPTDPPDDRLFQGVPEGLGTRRNADRLGGCTTVGLRPATGHPGHPPGRRRPDAAHRRQRRRSISRGDRRPSDARRQPERSGGLLHARPESARREPARSGPWRSPRSCSCSGWAVAVAQPARATYPGSTDGRLAIGAEVDGNVDIYTVLPNGAAVHRLTTDPLFDACPAWSADGKRLAWCHGIRARGGNIEIWTMNLDGTDKTQVTSLGGRMTFPDFSPNGSRIAFGGRLPGATNDDIFSIGSDGTGLVQLTSDPANDSLPAYSPTARRSPSSAAAAASTRSG